MTDQKSVRKFLQFIQYAALANSLYQFSEGNYPSAIASLVVALTLEKMIVAFTNYCREYMPLKMRNTADDIAKNYSYPSQAFGLFAEKISEQANNKNLQEKVGAIQIYARQGINKAQDEIQHLVSSCRK